jgi:hypothetical protein
MHNVQVFIIYTAAIFSVLSFLVYLAEAVLSHLDGSRKEVQKLATRAFDPLSLVDDAAKLADAVSKLTDSLAKAGPSLTSLLASIFFLVIAAYTSVAADKPCSANPSPAAAGSVAQPDKAH